MPSKTACPTAWIKAMAGKKQQGVTLVELMVTVAIIAVIAGIAIPLYNGYVREARLSAARANVEPLRLALEDYWLDNDTYVSGVWIPGGSRTLETANNGLGWKPDGDENKFDYNVTAANGGNISSSYTISVTHRDLPNDPVTFTKSP
ncbi:MAG: prepilin-type N-terminal cleavage/methylation domain-containing protein [Sedimenticola sp.]